MRTKALLLTAAVSALGMAAASAQVYSVNAVGYVNVTVKKGYNLIANPLDNGDNKLMTILPSATTPLPDDTFVFTWNPDGPSIGNLDPDIPVFYPGPAGVGGWEPAGPTIAPGKGFWLYINPAAPQSTYTITFVGQVAQGELSNRIVGGGKYNMLSSQVPQTGKLVADLGFPGVQDDILMIWNPTAGAFAKPLIFDEGVGFNDGNEIFDPEIPVGGGFFLFRNSAANTPWNRSFNVNQ